MSEDYIRIKISNARGRQGIKGDQGIQGPMGDLTPASQTILNSVVATTTSNKNAAEASKVASQANATAALTSKTTALAAQTAATTQNNQAKAQALAAKGFRDQTADLLVQAQVLIDNIPDTSNLSPASQLILNNAIAAVNAGAAATEASSQTAQQSASATNALKNQSQAAKAAAELAETNAETAQAATQAILAQVQAIYAAIQAGGGGSTPAPTLVDLVMVGLNLQLGVINSGNITGAATGSVLSLLTPPAGLTVNSAARTWSYAGTGSAGTKNFNLREVLAGATGSPHDTPFGITIGAAQAPSVISAPTLNFAPGRINGTNPMAIEINTDNTVFDFDDGFSPIGTYDFVEMRRGTHSNGVANYNGAVYDLLRLTPDVMAVLTDPAEATAAVTSFLPNCLTNTPAGAVAVSTRIRRGAVPGRILNIGDSFTAAEFNWIYPYQQAHPELEHLRNARSGSHLVDPYEANGLLQHMNEYAALAPAYISGLIGGNDLSDINVYPTTQSYFDALVAFWQASRIANPQAKIIWATTLALGSNVANYALHNSRRAVLNPMVRAAVGVYIDAVADYAADPVIGTDAAANNTDYFSDGLHPTPGMAQANMGPIYAATMNTVIALPKTWVDSNWSNDLTDTLNAAPVVAVTTFDPTKKSNQAVLSGGNRQINGTAGIGAATSARTTTSRNAGHLYAEMANIVTNQAFVRGACNGNYNPATDGVGLPPAGTAVSLYGDGSYIFDLANSAVQNAVITGGGFEANSKTLGIELKLDASPRTVEFFCNGNAVGGPQTLPAGPIFLFAGPAVNTDQAILNTGQEAFLFQRPNTTAWG